MKNKIACIGLALLWLSFSTAHPRVSSLDTSKIERLVFETVNKERSKKGLGEYKYSEELAKLAGTHSANMAKYKFFSHVDHEKRDLGERKMAFCPGLFAGKMGENIAYVFGRSEGQVAKILMKQWMSSSGHRGNILNKGYTHVGIGVRQKGGYFYATQVFGDLVAVMVGKLPEVVPYGSEQKLRFEFLGDFPKKQLSVFVHFPDKTARSHVKGRSYFVGRGLYEPEWDGKNFAVTVKFTKGRGTYKLTMGKHGTYYADGLKILVK